MNRALLTTVLRILGLSLLGLCILGLGACTSGGGEARRLPDTASAVATRYASECDEEIGPSCYALALLYHLGEDGYHGVPADRDHAEALRVRACELGHAPACEDDALSPPESVLPPDP